MNAQGQGRGFTLLELMVTLAVAAILAVIALPSFRDLLRKNQVGSASNALLADLSYARSEAITRGNIVSICPSSDGASCTTNGQAYESGWLVYSYTPGNGKATTAFDSSKASATGTNQLLRYTQARAGVSVQSNSTSIISFGPQGQTLPATSTYTFWTCFRAEGEPGTGTSTTRVPGTALSVSASGSVTSQPLGSQAACTPS
ncbi:MAG TPA: GspH/FimT family pseudopilin [Frateuria sp.]|uniref:GspH/FimT family pseudopilin n=1 Tax=Frateuria sp. TaxID=2211372 RepID=UPI002DF48704|nr:GspH/FimT family pseudopilin [Frateuria sp.]